jgi:DNA-binding LacI/PurR family transcriptional regulator
MTSERQNTARQADIARKAGVSQSTVSLVLTGGGDIARVSPTTYSRVLNAATELGYDGPITTKPRSRRLQLGVHTFEPIFPTRIGDYYSTFLSSIEEQATTEGCNLILFTALHHAGIDGRLYQEGKNELRHASGSILLGRSANEQDLIRLVSDKYPFVYVGERELDGYELNYVGADYRSATGELTAELLALGHREFAYLGEPVRTAQQTQRWEGFRDALQRFGVTPPEAAFLSPEQISAAWLQAQRGRGVTALLVEAASQLKVVDTLAKLAKIDIPTDLSVLLLVDLPEDGTLAHRSWAQLLVPRAEMGRQAVQLLIQTIRNPTGDYSRQILLRCDYTLGTTVDAPYQQTTTTRT